MVAKKTLFVIQKPFKFTVNRPKLGVLRDQLRYVERDVSENKKNGRLNEFQLSRLIKKLCLPNILTALTF